MVGLTGRREEVARRTILDDDDDDINIIHRTPMQQILYEELSRMERENRNAQNNHQENDEEVILVEVPPENIDDDDDDEVNILLQFPGYHQIYPRQLQDYHHRYITIDSDWHNASMYDSLHHIRAYLSDGYIDRCDFIMDGNVNFIMIFTGHPVIPEHNFRIIVRNENEDKLQEFNFGHVFKNLLWYVYEHEYDCEFPYQYENGDFVWEITSNINLPLPQNAIIEDDDNANEPPNKRRNSCILQ